MNFLSLLWLLPILTISVMALPVVLIFGYELVEAVRTFRNSAAFGDIKRDSASLAWANFKFGMRLFARSYIAGIKHYAKVIASWLFMVPLLVVFTPLALLRGACTVIGNVIEDFAEFVSALSVPLCTPARRSIGMA